MDENGINSGNSSISDMFATKKDSPKKLDENIITKLPCIDASEDNEGYYIPKIKEIINSNYIVNSIIGKGVFSCVYNVSMMNDHNKHYALKILRSNDLMRMSGEKEKNYLTKLNKNDPEGLFSVIRLYDSFLIKDQLCLVFEKLEFSLRDLIKNEFKNGFPLCVVKSYARQLVFGLSFIHSHKLMHLDFKLDNVICYNNKENIKISDFGSALFEDEAFQTQNLIPRFYRPPELFFGCKYDCKVDMWSLGCLLFELYTTKVLFPGKDNSETVKSILELRGKPAYRFLKQGVYTNQFFRENGMGNFIMIETDLSTKQQKIVEIPFNNDPNSTILLEKLKSKYNTEETLFKDTNLNSAFFNNKKKSNLKSNELLLFMDFLEKCLAIDPSKRISSLEAIVHPFINNNSEL